MIQRNFPAPASLDLKTFAPQPALEPLHLALPPSRRLMRILSSIVLVTRGCADGVDCDTTHYPVLGASAKSTLELDRYSLASYVMSARLKA